MKFKHFVGIDVSKEKFDCELEISQEKVGVETFSNNLKGISQFIQWLNQSGIDINSCLIVMEHTGHYIDRLTRVLYGEGFFAWVVSPLFLHQFSPKPIRNINDTVAATKIREYGKYFQSLAQKYIPDSPFDDELKKLFRLRKQLVKLRATICNMQASNQDLSTPHSIADQIWQEQIATFDQYIKVVEEMLKEHLLKKPEYRRMYTILLSIPGIGPVCASQMLILTKGFTKFRNFRAFASFIATAPFGKSSGQKSRKPKVLKAGHKQMKKNLYLAVLRNLQLGNYFEEYYRYSTETLKKQHNSVMNALINKLLKIAFDLIRINEEFDIKKYISGKQKPASNLVLS